MIMVSPSLLSSDFARMGEDVRKVTAAGADALHLDVMDGMFVPNITFGPCVVEAIRPYSDLPFDVHLMIESPERYIERFIEAGADWITVHYEACRDINVALDTIRLHGKRVGLSVKPKTPVEEIYPLLDRCDMILIMTVEPGFGGQAFIPYTLEKIKALREELSRRGLSDIAIEVDGGINPETAKQAVEAGADILVAGSAVFRASDMAGAIAALRGEE